MKYANAPSLFVARQGIADTDWDKEVRLIVKQAEVCCGNSTLTSNGIVCEIDRRLAGTKTFDSISEVRCVLINRWVGLVRVL